MEVKKCGVIELMCCVFWTRHLQLVR